MARGEREHDERGAATAELVTLLPLVAVVALLCVWLLSLASAELRLVDGTREAARMLARGDDQDAAVGTGARIAPPGTRFTVEQGADEVTVAASVEVRAPLGLGTFRPSTVLRAEAVAAMEW